MSVMLLDRWPEIYSALIRRALDPIAESHTTPLSGDLCWALAEVGPFDLAVEDAVRLGARALVTALRSSNREAYAARYPDRAEAALHACPPRPLRVRRRGEPMGAPALLKALRCADYNSELPDDGPDRARLDAVMRALTDAVLDSVREYREALWG